MPTILEIRGFKFIIFTNDHSPAHVHVRKGSGGAKILLMPIEIVEYKELKPKELRLIHEIVEEHLEYLLQKWDELHGE